MERKDTLPLWFNQGNCTDLGVDAGIMVPEPGDEDGELAAKVICVACDVECLCLAWALKNRRNDMGVYGAKTANERNHISRKIRRNDNGRTRES